jgi:TDG/mug DNA glycosylase family protein
LLSKTVISAVPQDYAERCAWLLAHGVGLWDVYASCERQGSLDSAIRQPVVNDFAGILAVCPNLQLIAHNGGESFKHARHTQGFACAGGQTALQQSCQRQLVIRAQKAAWVAALMAMVLGPDRSASALR